MDTKRYEQRLEEIDAERSEMELDEIDRMRNDGGLAPEIAHRPDNEHTLQHQSDTLQHQSDTDLQS